MRNSEHAGLKPRHHDVRGDAPVWRQGFSPALAARGEAQMWRQGFSPALGTWRRGFSPALAVLALSCLALLGGAACRQDMHNAPRVDPYEETDAFADGRGMRPLPEGTVARGHLNEDELMFTGKVNGQFADEFPFPVTRDVLERGHDRFNVYCSPCHGRTAEGNGMIVQRGLRPPPSFHEDKIRTLPVGYYFDVITNGFGAMQDYRMQLEPKDRWAVASYIRALQYSQRASVADVPSDKRGELDKPAGEETKPAPSHGEH